MSNRAVFVLVVVAAVASFVHDRLTPAGAERRPAVVEEIRRTIRLEPGASVEVSSNGPRVNVERSSSTAAEIRVVRRAASRADLDGHRVVIDGTSSHLVVHAESPAAPPCWSFADEASQEVTLLVPESVSVTTHTFTDGVIFG